MTQEQILKKKLPNLDDDSIEILLNESKGVILRKRYPFGNYPLNELNETYVEDDYLDLQIRIAVEMDSRVGAEGETSHTENSVQRVYDTGNISPSLLNEITPKAGVL